MKILSASILALLATVSQTALAESILVLKSDKGDYIGGGINSTYTDKLTTFKYSGNYNNGITVNINTGTTSWWTLNLAAPNNEKLKPGLYKGAERFPFQKTTYPGLDFSGNGRGCNTLTGSFNVSDVSYDTGGTLKSLSATFEQHCEGAVPALRGTLTYNLHPVIGALSIGMTPISAQCTNKSTGQKITFKTTTAKFNCREHGLIANKNDEIALIIRGISNLSE
ncbi:MAG: hypothetical protein Q8R10_07970 [Pseudomonas sp.]|uniref:hypothetical protein n=1 Tax=Pseudomonas sp. TaxID=306 RepID=UPI0027330998|nr:hypothetical protein [Pseudomonas sp.]MDP3846343.1 hypothetical protein [Pseudomonas sp.]